MFTSLYTVSIRRKFYGRVYSPIDKLCFFQLSPFSSAVSANMKLISKASNHNTFAVDYLINTLGFPPEKALCASKHMAFHSAEKPDLVVAFFRKHGFTQAQTAMIARKFPLIVRCDPQKTLLPKIEFFRSLGFSEAEMNKVFLTSPHIFTRSLKRRIEPVLNYVKSLFDATGTSLCHFKYAAEAVCSDLESRLLPNIEVLKEAGVPLKKIVHLLQYLPKTVTEDAERFRKSVEDVKQMGINPSAVAFVVAIYLSHVMSRSCWEKRLAAYKKWGLTEDEILVAFRKYPFCMRVSVDKITAAMDFFVNEMGLDSSFVTKAPTLVAYSLEKRIKPRSSVYNKLVDSGLIKKGDLLVGMYKYTERDFLKKYVVCYEEYAPRLLEIYRKELAIAKDKDSAEEVDPHE